MDGWFPSRRKTGTSSFVYARRHNRQMIILAAIAGEPLRFLLLRSCSLVMLGVHCLGLGLFNTTNFAWCNGSLTYSGDSPEPCNNLEGLSQGHDEGSASWMQRRSFSAIYVGGLC
jgi:hypothetical protein